MELDYTPSEIIDRLGGPSKVAAMFGIKPPSVCEWRNTGIPNARLMYLRLLRPDLFDERAVVRQPAPGAEKAA